MKKIFLFLCCCLILGSSKSQDYYYIEDFFVDLKLEKNGILHVTELIKVHYNEPRHGIYRDIPLSVNIAPDVSGVWLDKWFAHRMFISDVDVKNYKFSKMYSGNGIRLKIGDKDVFVNGEQLYQISYTIENGLLHNKQHTELYWNLIGDFIEEEVRHAGFKVTIPSDIVINPEDVNVWTGTYGQRESKVTTNIESNIITGETTESLGRRKAMTVAVRMAPGAVEAYPSYKLWIHHFKFLLLPLLVFFGFWYLWWKHGNDTRLADMVAYLPPKKMDPSMAGYAIDIKANKRDALALIPWFGANGYLKVEHEEKKGIFAKDEITFYKLKNLPDNAPVHQKLFFNGLFEDGSTVKLSSLENSFHSTLDSTLSAIKDSVINSNYFTSNSVKLYRNSIWIIILLGIANMVLCFFSGRFIFLGITILITAFLVIYAYVLLKRSQSGDELFKEIKGFRKFIRIAEKDKLEFLIKEDPSYFDKTLPYAIAFDCADEWSKKFKGLELAAPVWYSSNVPFYTSMHGFNVTQFNNVMSSSLSEMRTVMSSTPSSSGSGSSGGGGGGFSGGGFGGGGVSSW